VPLTPRLRSAVLASAVAALTAAGCSKTPEAPGETPPAPPPAPAPGAPAQTPEPPAPSPSPAVTRAEAERAAAWLRDRLRAPARDAADPWMLAHGLLAFGPTFEADDGRPAIDVIASHATPREVDGVQRYGFIAARDGRPIEPHPHLHVLTLSRVLADPARPLRAADGETISLARLVDDMRAVVRLPTSDVAWLESAWWMQAVEEAFARDGKAPPGLALPALRAAAVARLEQDDAVLRLDPGPAPFAPNAPMGAAKRAKSHIYAHACGGLHFVQAVVTAAARSGDAALVDRARAQIRLLLARQRAERALYADTLASHPSATLVLRAQQLKFFGHLLETLQHVSAVGLLEPGSTLADAVARARREATADLVDAIDGLRDAGAYEQLDALPPDQAQLRRDLVGDGCHAVHALAKAEPPPARP